MKAGVYMVLIQIYLKKIKRGAGKSNRILD